MIYDITQTENKHFAVSSYYHLKLDNDKFVINTKDTVGVYLLVSGEGTLYSHDGERNRVFSKIKSQEVICCHDLNGYISFDGRAEVIGVEITLNENRNELVKNSLDLGDGDIIEKHYQHHIDVQSIVEQVENLYKNVIAQKALVFSCNLHTIHNIMRIVDLINSNRIKYHDNYFTELLIGELYLNLNQKYSELTSGNTHVAKILAYIDRNYKEELSLEKIAQGVNLNVSYMQKVFKDKMGNTVYDTLNQVRINQAVTLMKTTKLPIIDIAFEVGFASRQTFYNVFKSFMGYTPKTFRKFLTISHNNDKFTD